MRHSLFTLTAVLCAALFSKTGLLRAQEQIIPRPADIQYPAQSVQGPVLLKNSLRALCREKDPEFLRKAKGVLDYLSHGTGLPVSTGNEGTIVEFRKDPSMQKYGPESYSITAVPGKLLICASSEKGIFYAGQSLAQMLPAEFFGASEEKKTVSWLLAEKSFKILDYPRFSWRAFMLDEARHFFGEKECKRILDQMALLKMNVLHWHLSDDIGWRIEIKKYPRLAGIGGKRKDTESGSWPKGDGSMAGKPHEGFYTQEQIRRIVQYAADRNITIIPEIDVPGHSAPIGVAYPELELSAKPLKEMPVKFAEIGVLDPTQEKTYQFLSHVFDELIALFPAKIIHTGGDEVRYKQCWEGVPHIEEYMKKNGIKKYTDLQMRFSNRLSKMLAQKGCRMMGWNEILGTDIHNDGGQGNASETLDKKAVIHFWQGSPQLAKKAAETGHQIVNSTYQWTYINRKDLSLQKAYSFEPVFAGLEEKYARNVIGTGCQAWTEWLQTADKLYKYIFPRLAAHAETGWTPKEQKNYDSFLKRIGNYERILDKNGIPHIRENRDLP